MKIWKHPAMSWHEDFQKHILKQMPFMNKDTHLNGIATYVQNAIKQYMPSNVFPQAGLQPMVSNTLDYNIFETHRSVFVRCRLPADTPHDEIKFYANRRNVKVDLPGSSEEISLPSDVIANRTTAKIKDGILELRLPKIKHSDPYKEITIRDGNEDQAK